MHIAIGNQLSTTVTASTLEVNSPISWLALVLAFGSPLFFVCLRAAELALEPRKPLSKGWVIVQTAATLFFLGFVCSPASIRLDARSGTATVWQLLFFIPHRHVYPLQDVAGAGIASSDEADALRLDLKNGEAIQLTPYNQMTGKGTAISAINAFVALHTASAQKPDSGSSANLSLPPLSRRRDTAAWQ